MISYTIAEWKKMKKPSMFSIGLLFLLISTFVALFTYYYYHNNIVSGTEGKVLWGQLTLYNSSLLYPPLLAIFVGMSFLPEFERKTLNMLQANRVSMYKFVASKIITLIGIILPLQMLYLVIYSIIAAYDGIFSMNDLFIRFRWVLLSIIGSLPILLIQSYIFARTQNFSKSVTLGAIGGVFTFALMFINEKVNQFYPYAQPMVALRSREMSVVSVSDFSMVQIGIFLLVNIGYAVIFYVLCCWSLKHQD